VELEGLVESAGAAGAVAVESVLLGAVDCCLEQADTATRALRVRTRRLRFISITSLWCQNGHNVPSQDPFRER
jgi:hypothetical protein